VAPPASHSRTAPQCGSPPSDSLKPQARTRAGASTATRLLPRTHAGAPPPCPPLRPSAFRQETLPMSASAAPAASLEPFVSPSASTAKVGGSCTRFPTSHDAICLLRLAGMRRRRVSFFPPIPGCSMSLHQQSRRWSMRLVMI